MGREEPDRVVAPVVDQAAVEQVELGDEVVHRQQLDRRDAQVLEVVGSSRDVPRPAYDPRSSAGTSGCCIGQALDVRLVDHGLLPGHVRPPIVAPVERSSAPTTTLRGV